MDFKIRLVLFHGVLFSLLTNCFTKMPGIPQTQIASFENSTSFVVFNPYSSILDKEDRFRYNITSLIPFVSKVATRFSRIFILLTEMDLEADLQTSLAISPLAIATYNLLLPSNNPKLEVWLAYSSIQPEATYRNTFKYHQEPLLLKSRMENLVDKANIIFNGTVTKLLLPYTLLRINSDKILLNRTTDKDNRYRLFPASIYQWGTLLDSPECTYSPHYMTALEKIQFEVIIMVVVNSVVNDVKNDTPFKEFNRTLHHCQKYIPNGTPKGFLASIPDTDTYAAENITRLVTTWTKFINWSKEKNLEIIISKAFDTPYENTVEMKTSGWWRLKENPFYNNSNDYIFEEKALIMKQAEFKSTQKNLVWLKDEIKFSKSNTGIIFSAYDTKILDYPEEDMSIVLNYIATKFSKIVVKIQDPTSFGIKVMLFEIRNLVQLQGKIEIIQLIFIPQAVLETIMPKGWEHVTKKHHFSKLLFSTYVLQFTGKETFKYAKYCREVALANISSTNYKLGYAFNITTCQLYNDMDPYNASLVDKALNEAQVIYFTFEEDDETVKLGATRMFMQRRILLEECQKLLRKVNQLAKDINYLLLHYPAAVTSEFYSNSWRLQNLVKYWMLLNEWAENTNSTIILNNAVDGKRYVKERTETVPVLGWWRYQDVITNNNGKRWIDKQEDALEISLQDFHQKDEIIEDSSITILLSIIIMAVGVAVIFMGLGLYAILKYKRKMNLLQKKEDYSFYLGSINSENKPHEFKEGTFTIYEDECLGVGEFGKVVRGRIAATNGYQSQRVAVKINKPDKDTSLKGILAEIKVLSFVGKHENLTELLGVNTSNLEKGRVLMFLELCQLGSLQRYLRNHHQPKRGHWEESDLKRYANLMGNGILDDSQKEDLYRWSKEICKGMAYLAEKQVVHNDLATRNVLLNGNKVVKICDFGLSRKMYDNLNYVKTNEDEELPWKWLAPEALRKKEFNEKTDIWSYGVTLWEIYSLGGSPYPEYSWNKDGYFIDLLEEGLRLQGSWFDDKNMYSMMNECWKIDPNQRPTFAELCSKFD